MLQHVTFTGWDRHTDLTELATLCNDYPQERIEIAVLYSANQDDDDRYPQVGKAREILKAALAAGQRSAVHICGRAARSLLQEVEDDAAGARVFSRAAPLISLAHRVQVNVGEEFWPDGGDRYKRASLVAKAIGRPVIIQSRDTSDWPDVEHFWPGASRMVPFLFDRSAGAGADLMMSDWPMPIPGRLVGYAGGLGPDSAPTLCRRLAETVGARWWIDMETRIREEFDNADTGPGEPQSATFVSIEKCRAVMAACERWFRRAF